DKNSYPKGIKIPDEMLEQINIVRSDFYGEWNYTITPRNVSDCL
ncbi:MAG: ISAzo13 family transposase, partial [Euryarchaeota archaeon]|nr:ISAzo13 family transposase [Euryarchaeota archaeon]